MKTALPSPARVRPSMLPYRAAGWRALLPFLILMGPARAGVIFETTSAYHHILVVDQAGIRILSFDGSQESRMSIAYPLRGHFEYTEFFHMPWLWNDRIQSVLMIGLGGASTPRSFQRYYPSVRIDAVEIDPAVVRVAKRFFHLKTSPALAIHLSDGRVFLRRSTKRYDAIIMDAYTSNRYGSFIPRHLATREFFTLARRHLTQRGTIAYNVIGTLGSRRSSILGALYRTMRQVFPQVYLFPAGESRNVVIIGTMEARRLGRNDVARRLRQLAAKGKLKLPTFARRAQAMLSRPPASVRASPVLTDDFAPVDGLVR